MVMRYVKSVSQVSQPSHSAMLEIWTIHYVRLVGISGIFACPHLSKDVILASIGPRTNKITK